MSEGVGKVIIVLFLLLILVGGGAYAYLKYRKPNVPPPQTISVEEVLQKLEVEWCTPQDLLVDLDKESPKSSRIIGYDDVNSCCEYEVIGYNCALQNNVSLRYCLTGDLGGQYKYVNINNKDYNVKNIQQYLDDIDREFIQYKYCNMSIYG